jgi:hypothetical protein
MVRVFAKVGAALSLLLIFGFPIIIGMHEQNHVGGIVGGLFAGFVATGILWMVGTPIVYFLSIIFGWEWER